MLLLLRLRQVLGLVRLALYEQGGVPLQVELEGEGEVVRETIVGRISGASTVVESGLLVRGHDCPCFVRDGLVEVERNEADFRLKALLFLGCITHGRLLFECGLLWRHLLHCWRAVRGLRFN